MCAKGLKIMQPGGATTAIVIALVLAGVLFSLPLLALLCVLYYVYIYDNPDNKAVRYSIYLFLAFLMGYLNTSRPVDFSDIGYYYWLYNFTGTQSFGDFISLIPKEPIFHIYTYLMYFITFGSFKIYLIATTMLMYMLVFVSYDIVCRNCDVDLRYSMVACVVMLFFSEYFFYTSQIVRQVLAGSVAIFGITKTTFESNRWSIWLIAMAGLIHASAFFFSIYYVIYFFRNYPLKYLISATVVAVVFYGVILRLVGDFMDTDTTIGIAIGRGLSSDDESISIGILPLLICFSVVPLSAYIIFAYRNLKLSLWVIMPVLLMIFILVNFGRSLLVLRFMEYIYMYIPILLVVSIIRLIRTKTILVMTLIMAVMAARFLLKIGNSNFSYMSIPDFITSGLPVCLFNIF